MRIRLAQRGTLLVAFAILMAACGDGSEPSGGTQETGPATTSETGSGELEGLVTAGTLTVGSCLDLAPFDYVEGGMPTGFDIALLSAIADNLGLEPVFIRTNFDTIFTSVAAGAFDVASSFIVVTPEREEVVAFTAPYYTTQLSLIVNSSETPSVVSFDDLQSGDTVGVQRGSVQLTWAEENLAPRGVRIKTFATFPAAFLDLQAGRITGVVGEALSAAEGIRELAALEIVESLNSGEAIAFAVPNNNPELKAAIDQAIQDLFADGTYAEIFEQYLPGVPIPTELPAE